MRTVDPNATSRVKEWVRCLSPGQRSVYHTGNLAEDRAFSYELDQIALAVWEAYLKGHIILFQERKTQTTFIYYMQRRQCYEYA